MNKIKLRNKNLKKNVTGLRGFYGGWGWSKGELTRNWRKNYIIKNTAGYVIFLFHIFFFYFELLIDIDFFFFFFFFLVDHAVAEEKIKKTNELLLKILMERLTKGEDISSELGEIKREREEREKKKGEMQKRLERMIEKEKLLIEIIQKRLKKEEREGQERFYIFLFVFLYLFIYSPLNSPQHTTKKKKKKKKKTE